MRKIKQFKALSGDGYRKLIEEGERVQFFRVMEMLVCW